MGSSETPRVTATSAARNPHKKESKLNVSQLRALSRLMVLNAVLASSVACISVRKHSEPESAAPAGGTVKRHGYMIANYTIRDPETFKK